jgi:hypothetical protein
VYRRDKLTIDFDPCENDNVNTVSCEHNAAFSLEHDMTKWMSCFSKETRNLIRIDQQLIKCYDLLEDGKKVRLKSTANDGLTNEF